MKNKLTIYISLFLMTLCSLTMAQRIGLDAGYTMNVLEQSDNGISGDLELMNGFHVGPRFEMFLCDSSHWSISAAALFEMRAARYDVSWYEPSTTCTRTLYYALIPVDLAYYFPLKGRLNLMVFGGPRFNIGLFGDYSNHFYMATRDYKEVNPFGDEMDRFDFSVGLGVGVDYRGMFAKIGYDFPCSNSAGNVSPKILRQHEFRFSIGYMLDLRLFGKDKKKSKNSKPHTRMPMKMSPQEAMPGMNKGGFMRR